jgi:hypothetical protein
MKKSNAKETKIKVTSAETYVNGKPDMPDLVDHKIESEDYRARFEENEAVVCIGVQPGEDVLGQFYVNVQLEAKSGKGKPEKEAVELYNKCIQKQGDFLGDTAELLADILGEFEAEWEVNIAAMPCPKATKKVDLQAVANKLENKVERSRTADNEVKRSVERTLEVKS